MHWTVRAALCFAMLIGCVSSVVRAVRTGPWELWGFLSTLSVVGALWIVRIEGLIDELRSRRY